MDEIVLRAMYQRVFLGSVEGKKVLADILKDINLMAVVDIDDPGAAALKNFGWLLLHKLGPAKAGYDAFVDAMAKMPIKEDPHARNAK